jgi:quercetin dioxygenase-like cupin family protein
MALLETDPTTTKCPAGEIPYVEMMEGVELKVLRVGGPSGTYTLMTRFAPGITLPKHRHFGEVHAYTISGRWHYREYDWVSETGDYVYEPPNSTHTLTVPPDNDGPTEVVFVIDKGMVILGDDDELLLIEDAWSITEMYLGALAARGIEAPAGILP